MSGDDQRQGARKAEAEHDRSDRAKSGADRERRYKSEQKADAQRKAEWARAEERRVTEARRREEQRRASQRRDALRKEFRQRAQDAKAAAEKERARKQSEAAKKAEAVKADRQRTITADIRRRAEAAAAERQRHQKAQQLEEHRRQTDQMRGQHRAEMQSHRENEAVGVARHAQEIQRIDDLERDALNALEARRGSLIGRSVALVRGQGHYDRQAETIAEHCEGMRMSRHRDLEALKERQFSAAQQARLRQAHERKGIFELHRHERQQLAVAHGRGREAQVGAYERAFARAARREERSHPHGRERGPSRRR